MTDIYAAVKISLNLKYLINEYEIMKTLRHPNIVKLIQFHNSIDYVKRDGRKVNVAAIAMELAQGDDLFEFVANSGKFSESSLASISSKSLKVNRCKMILFFVDNLSA